MRKGSALARSSRVHETTMSVGYSPEPPALAMRPAAVSRSSVLLSRHSAGALSLAHRTSPRATMCGPRSQSRSSLWTNRMSALVTSQEFCIRLRSLGTT